MVNLFKNHLSNYFFFVLSSKDAIWYVLTDAYFKRNSDHVWYCARGFESQCRQLIPQVRFLNPNFWQEVS